MSSSLPTPLVKTAKYSRMRTFTMMTTISNMIPRTTRILDVAMTTMLKTKNGHKARRELKQTKVARLPQPEQTHDQ